jgi:CubicO group peptidase (beta-lactamase class C family)
MTRPSFSLLAVAVAAAVGASAARAQRPADRVDSVFAAHRGTDRAGCAVGVVQAGKPVFAKGYGMADLAQGLAITPHSVFHVASVSKQFAAMSLVLLARAGRLSLDDDIRKYLPEMPVYERPITIRHLLTHTSGIRDQWNLLITSGWRLGDDLITEQDVIDVVTAQRTLNFPPGSDWNYSNSGFTLAAVIVKRVTGQSLRQFADSAMFQPLGMTETHFHDDNLHIVPGRTRGHTFRNGEWKETYPNYSTVGATSLFTTVVDLARWHAQLDSGLVGGRAAIDELIRPAVLTSGDTLSYALGVFVGSYRGVPTISHSGGDPGYSSHLLHFPRTRSGVSVLCNSSGVAAPTRLAEQVADIFLEKELGPVPPVPAQVTAAAVAGAEGLYWSETAEAMGRLVVENGLALWRPGAGTAGGAPLRVSGVDRRWLVGTGPATLTMLPDGTLRLRAATGEPSSYTKVADWAPTAADRATLAGRYRSPELDVTWEVRAAGDSLTVHRRKYPPVRLTPAFRDTYTAPGLGGFILRAIRGPKGAITAVTVGSGRVRRVVFERVADRR